MAYNPENKIIRNIDQFAVGIGDKIVSRAYEECETLLRENRISLENFRDLYGDKRIQEAQLLLEEKRKARAEESTDMKDVRKLATVCEGLFYRGGNEWGWMGADARVIAASEYDDEVNYVDGIVEFRGKDERVRHTAFGVDVTFGAGSTVVKKFEGIKQSIRNGALAKVEYFQSENFRGELLSVPRVVIGAEKKHIIQVLGENDLRRLERNPYQLLLLRQMRLQLEAFSRYAMIHNQQKIADILKNDEAIVRKLAQRKSAVEGIRLTKDLEDDKVYLAIQDELHKF